jgi:uncharacterized protein YkwD
VRKTPKFLPTALLTLILLLLASLAAPAWGRPGGHTVHHRFRPKRGQAHAKRLQAPKAAKLKVKRTITAPVPAVAKRTRERPAREKQSAPAAAAATIASLLATPCQNTEVTPEASNLQAVRESVACLINRVRAEHSLAPLTVNAELQSAAENHDAEMLQVDYFAHVAPDGETPVERIEKTGYIAGESEGYVIGENLAWGTYSLATPKAIVEAWVASPGHLANILESRYTETGISVVPAVPQSLGEGNPGALYAQEFGVILE